jgi:hypothetical protein
MPFFSSAVKSFGVSIVTGNLFLAEHHYRVVDAEAEGENRKFY